MDIQQIVDLLKRIEEMSFTEVVIMDGIFYIKASRSVQACPPLTQAQVPVQTAAAPVETEKNYSNCIAVKSPLPGTFFSAPAPDKPPFVKISDHVKKGQMLCIIESMKMMNEVETEADGKIVAINCTDGEKVDCATVLFLIDTSVQCPKSNGHGRKAKTQIPVLY